MSYCDHLPSVVRPSKLLNDFSSVTPRPIFFKHHVEPSVKGGLNICSNSHISFIKMAAMPIHGKTLKDFLLQNQESFKAEFWYIESWTQGLQVCSNDVPRLTIDLFTAEGYCQFVQMVLHHQTKWPPCPYMVKTLKILLLQNQESFGAESDI